MNFAVGLPGLLQPGGQGLELGWGGDSLFFLQAEGLSAISEKALSDDSGEEAELAHAARA